MKRPSRLGNLTRAVLEDHGATLYLSSINAYEATIKQRLGRLDSSYDSVIAIYPKLVKQLGALDLPVSLAHTFLAGSMDWDHPDPFDRLLVAQASLENLVVITDDSLVKGHPWIDTVWCDR